MHARRRLIAASALAAAVSVGLPGLASAAPAATPPVAHEPIHMTPQQAVEAELDSIGEITRAYRAFFGRLGDPAGVDHWTAQLDSGTPLSRITTLFGGSREFRATYDPMDDGEFVDAMYLRALGRVADPDGRAFWVGALEDGRLTRLQIVQMIAESGENVRLSANKTYVVAAYHVLGHMTPTMTKVEDMASHLDDESMTHGEVIDLIQDDIDA